MMKRQFYMDKELHRSDQHFFAEVLPQVVKAGSFLREEKEPAFFIRTDRR
ncbi:hypothetical protein PthBH41_31810 [Parageobacillus thermoglucosidasius]|nr:hypothetical protein B4168_2378 [Anoxybacillus flavithermus]OAO87803.1 hypothetical protein GT23_0950 [Parageobacillus thermoglucosidasius]BDG33469.1 hypothetical protein PthBH41_31810 [Parageobacillus thermoglucosidasius]